MGARTVRSPTAGRARGPRSARARPPVDPRRARAARSPRSRGRPRVRRALPLRRSRGPPPPPSSSSSTSSREKASAIRSQIADSGVPVKIRSPRSTAPPHTMATPIPDTSLPSGHDARAPAKPAAPLTRSYPPNGRGLPCHSEMSASTPTAAIANPMNIRRRSCSADPRSSINPQDSARIGKTTAAIPNVACRSQSSPRPTGPADPNQSPSTARSASTTRPIPRASRAQGRRWLLTEGRFFVLWPRPFVVLATTPPRSREGSRACAA